MIYAKVIIDISAESVDRAFTYAVPPEMEGAVSPGTHVKVPFGKADRQREGLVIGLSREPDIESGKIKSISSLVPLKLDPGKDLIRLAAFMAGEYGCTMNQALKAVLPVKRSVRKNKRRTDPVEAIGSLGRDESARYTLSPEQQRVYEEVLYEKKPSLIYGITGSGKTRVYIELIKNARERGLSSIVLIPEISLAYQTVRELLKYLGEGVSVIHSKLGAGEKYEQFLKCLNGENDVCVGPRSALFTPFKNLGLIIIDEEHERTYRSDTAPRYDAREAAEVRAALSGAKLVLGSATPSLESYTRALYGGYRLHKLTKRVHEGASLPHIHVADMRKELANGNRGIFSGKLLSMIEDRLAKKEQVMLFLNRRGYAGFVSCRSCGLVLKCPHCDVSLTVHNRWYEDPATEKKKGALLSCHYCGYSTGLPKVCPDCGSRYIAPFKAGTEKLEQQVKKMFPESRILRMDADTTARKGSYEKILSSFKDGEADILIGTQMIVKGHDFENVTLVGIVAADLSLNSAEFDASERTYQLITQAAGRSGRGAVPGDTVIQSYAPDHYAISCAAGMDYESFYEREMGYRKLLRYPPVIYMLFFMLRGTDEEILTEASEYALKKAEASGEEELTIIGPCNEAVYKINDYYRKILYIKHFSHDIILRLRDSLTAAVNGAYQHKGVYVSAVVK